MATITVQLATERKVGSIMIRWFTWSPYSHIDIVLDNGDLLGARFKGGVLVRKPGYTNFTLTKRLTMTVTNQQKADFLAAAHSQVGKPYDYGAILSFAFHNRDWKHEEAWFCSELVAYCAEKAGVPLLRTTELTHITPRDVSISPLLHD